jgi:hypothetical protein
MLQPIFFVAADNRSKTASTFLSFLLAYLDPILLFVECMVAFCEFRSERLLSGRFVETRPEDQPPEQASRIC